VAPAGRPLGSTGKCTFFAANARAKGSGRGRRGGGESLSPIWASAHQEHVRINKAAEIKNGKKGRGGILNDHRLLQGILLMAGKTEAALHGKDGKLGGDKILRPFWGRAPSLQGLCEQRRQHVHDVPQGKKEALGPQCGVVMGNQIQVTLATSRASSRGRRGSHNKTRKKKGTKPLSGRIGATVGARRIETASMKLRWVGVRLSPVGTAGGMAEREEGLMKV